MESLVYDMGVKDLFLYRNALNGKAGIQKSTCKACAPVRDLVVWLFILNVFKFCLPLGNSSAFPWRFAVVSWRTDFEIAL